jgi:hypothetical protein
MSSRAARADATRARGNCNSVFSTGATSRLRKDFFEVKGALPGKNE